MTKLITLRVPVEILNKVKKTFKKDTQTESFLKAIELGLKFSELNKSKMANDYASIEIDEFPFVNDSHEFINEVIR